MPKEELQSIKSCLELKNSLVHQKAQSQANDEAYANMLAEEGIDYLG